MTTETRTPAQGTSSPTISPVPPADVALSIRDLDIYYGSYEAVEGVTMDIPRHAVTAIIGPSGCGKSTVLRCLNRMHEVAPGARATGTVTLEGQDIYTSGVDPVQVRRRIGMLFQRPNPFPTMSIYDNVISGLKLNGRQPKGVLSETVERTLRQVGLWDEVSGTLGKSAADLSGGQQQRLCLARCLAVTPDVILMDEPCSALDPIATLKIEELMRELQTQYTIVIVTHNMQQAGRVADRTAFFMLNDNHRGSLVEYGETEQIFTNPRNKRTEEYVTGRFG